MKAWSDRRSEQGFGEELGVYKSVEVPVKDPSPFVVVAGFESVEYTLGTEHRRSELVTMAPVMSTLVSSLLLGLAAAQTVSRKTPEVHPKLTTWKCTKKGGCREQKSALVLDSASHPIYQKNDPTKGCGNWGSAPDPEVCPDQETCQKNCLMDGISNYGDYGVFTKGSEMTLTMKGKDGNIATPRVYLLAPGEQKYEILKLTGQEFTFDVDVSKLPCGMNGALYLSEMEANGGKSKLNKAGAYYGTGYCDAQCFVTPWVNGVVRLPSPLSLGLSQTSLLTPPRATSMARASAVTSSTSGKPTRAPPTWPPTPAPSPASTNAQAKNAAKKPAFATSPAAA